MFTYVYFYNKFSPVNCVCYIKCGVNSSLHNSGCCRRSVIPWITFLSGHSIHSGGDLQIYWCDIMWNKAPHIGPHQICSTYALCPFCGLEMNRDDNRGRWMISLASAVYGSSRVAPHLLRPYLVFQPNWGGGFDDLGFFQLLQSNSSPEGAHSVGVFSPTWSNSIQLLSTVRSRWWNNNFVVHVKVRQIIE